MFGDPGELFAHVGFAKQVPIKEKENRRPPFTQRVGMPVSRPVADRRRIGDVDHRRHIIERRRARENLGHAFHYAVAHDPRGQGAHLVSPCDKASEGLDRVVIDRERDRALPGQQADHLIVQRRGLRPITEPAGCCINRQHHAAQHRFVNQLALLFPFGLIGTRIGFRFARRVDRPGTREA